jgi:hypothetical protein
MYILKSTIRGFHFFKSYGWVRAKASFTNWTVKDPVWGCSSVKLRYKFESNGRSITGSDEKPFYMRFHAKTYAESLSRDLHPIIRVNPKNPQNTRFFELDQ